MKLRRTTKAGRKGGPRLYLVTRAAFLLALGPAPTLGGCLGEADIGRDPAELAALAEPTCRGRMGVIVVANASGQEIVGLRLVDPAHPGYELELASKQRRNTTTRYEVLWRDCGPDGRNGRTLIIDLATGERRRQGITIDPLPGAWVFVVPEGVF